MPIRLPQMKHVLSSPTTIFFPFFSFFSARVCKETARSSAERICATRCRSCACSSALSPLSRLEMGEAWAAAFCSASMALSLSGQRASNLFAALRSGGAAAGWLEVAVEEEAEGLGLCCPCCCCWWYASCNTQTRE